MAIVIQNYDCLKQRTKLCHGIDIYTYNRDSRQLKTFDINNNYSKHDDKVLNDWYLVYPVDVEESDKLIFMELCRTRRKNHHGVNDNR